MKSDATVQQAASSSWHQRLLVPVMALLLFWLAYDVTIWSSDAGREFFQKDFLVHATQLPSSDLSASAARTLTFEPGVRVHHWPDCAAPCYFAARMAFEPGDKGADWAFAPSYNTDNFAIYLNGALVDQRGTLVPEPSYHGKRSWLTRLPAALFVAGTNHVDVLLARRDEPASFGGAFMGPYTDLEPALAPRFFAYYELPRLQGLIGLTVAAVLLLISPLLRRRALLLWLAVLCVSWSLLSLYRLWFDFPFSNAARAGYYFVILNLVYLSLFNTFDLWSGNGERWHRLLAQGGFALIVLVYLLLGSSLDADRKEALLADSYQLVLCGLLLWKLVHHYGLHGEARVVEASLMLVVTSSAILDVLAQVSGVFHFYSLTRVLPFFLLGMLASLFYRNLRLYESDQAVLVSLRQELKSLYERRHADEQARTLNDERQRILQDMHDGVGGRLAALLQTQRSNPNADPAVTKELEHSMQELLLVIDSLDVELGDDLGSALGVLRQRLMPSLQNAGVALDWQVDLPPNLGLGPERTLQIYRCLQEAFNNALRHSGGSVIRLCAVSAGDRVDITVSDNGCGLAACDSPGRGISIMHNRVQSLGGELAIDGVGEGTRLTFRVPLGVYAA